MLKASNQAKQIQMGLAAFSEVIKLVNISTGTSCMMLAYFKKKKKSLVLEKT